MDILKDLEKDCESRCQKFLKRYYRLIMKLAKRRLGEKFDPTEILSEAAIAFHRWSFYHSRSKRTKMPSSFSWFFNKRLDIYDRNGGCSVIDDREWKYRRHSKGNNEDEFSREDLSETVFDWHSRDGFLTADDDSCMEREERLFYGALNHGAEDIPLSEEARELGDEISDDEDPIPEEPYGARYLICIESFVKIPLLSSNLQKIFRRLSHDKQEANDIIYKRLTRNRSVRSAAKIVRGILQWHVSGTPYKLYTAVCLNGTRNHVLVLAKTEREAKKFLKPYGAMLELRQMAADK